MKDKKEFMKQLAELNGRPFAEYEKLIGDCDFGRFVVRLAATGFDPDQEVCAFTIRVPQSVAGFPYDLFETPVRRTALEDLLVRRFAAEAAEAAGGESSLLVAEPAPAILPRTTMVVNKEYVEVRLDIALPYHTLAYGRGGDPRVIDADAVEKIFFDDLPRTVAASMVYCNLDPDEVEYAVMLMEDATRLRQTLQTSGLVSFVAEGSLPAREEDGESPDLNTDPLLVADNAAVELDVPNGEPVRGAAVPVGLTVIVGEAEEGRLDLMEMIATGIYNHTPGDGRELAVTTADAVMVTCEPGRPVQRVDLTPFFKAGAETKEITQFTTASAEAFASQAASTIEALEAGARVLLFDEASSDPEFLGGDQRMSGLLDSQRIPLTARVRQMVDELGISVVVAGSSAVSGFLPLADKVLKIEGGGISDITAEAKALEIPAPAPAEKMDLGAVLDRTRWIMPSSIDPSCMDEDVLVEAHGMELLQFGRSLIDLSGVVQVADEYQVATIGHILYYARLRYMDERCPLREVLDWIDRDLTSEGLVGLTREVSGGLARPRRYEIAAALNRLSSFRVSHATR
jgi:predicted ABC-class ATPase